MKRSWMRVTDNPDSWRSDLAVNLIALGVFILAYIASGVR